MSDEEDVWTPERVTGKKMENRRTLSVSVCGQHTALRRKAVCVDYAGQMNFGTLSHRYYMRGEWIGNTL